MLEEKQEFLLHLILGIVLGCVLILFIVGASPLVLTLIIIAGIYLTQSVMDSSGKIAFYTGLVLSPLAWLSMGYTFVLG